MREADAFAARYFSGRELYGDNFDQSGIDQWFRDEEHGYADLQGVDRARHEYGYDALNSYHGFSNISPDRRFKHALGFGSNFGDELAPILSKLDRVTLLDSSDRYLVRELSGVPVEFLLAHPTGSIELPDDSVDLITCFGVLHHIPNVSKVMREFRRILIPGGILLVREPITTMGDWRNPRRGLTARERGIPRQLLLDMFSMSDLRVLHAADCQFPPMVKICQKLGVAAFRGRLTTLLDGLLASAFRFNYSYHRSGLWSRFAAAGLFVVASR